MTYPLLLPIPFIDRICRPMIPEWLYLCRVWCLFVPAVILLNCVESVERHILSLSLHLNMSSLIEAVKNNDVEIAKYHISDGSDVNRRSSQDGTTALYWAACTGHVQLCHMLIERGADVDIVSSQWGSRPLHAAADRGKIECAFLLIKSGANVNVQSTTSLDTPLHKAAYRGHSEVCRLLLENGADSSIKNKEGKTARQEAQSRKHYYIHTLILQYEEGKYRMEQRKSVSQIYKLSRPRPVDAVKAEITSPITIHQRHYAVCKGDEEGKGYITIEANSAGTSEPGDIQPSQPDVYNYDINEQDTEFSDIQGSDNDYGSNMSMLANYSNGGSTRMVYSSQPEPSIQAYNNKTETVAVPMKPDVIDCCNNGDHIDELNATRSYLHTTVAKLRKLEIFTEKLQVALTQYKDKVSQLKTENQELKNILKSMYDLEEQLRQAKLQVAWHSATADASNEEINSLKKQVVTLQKQYIELEEAYNYVCEHLKANRVPEVSNGSCSVTTEMDGINTRSDTYDADTESLSRMISLNHNRNLMGRGLVIRQFLDRGPPKDIPKPDELQDSCSSDNSSSLPRPRNNSPSSSNDSRQTRSPSRALQEIYATQASQPMSTKPLFNALTPVLTVAGREIMDMLSASLLFQTKNPMDQHQMVSHLLDLPGNVWNAESDFQISDDVCPLHCTGDAARPWSMLLNISHNSCDYKLKVILDKSLDQGTVKSANVNQVQLIQNIVLRNPHRNVSRILHGFRQNPSQRIRSFLPEVLQDDSINLAALHTVNPNFPANLDQLVDYARGRFDEPINVFPECFVLQQLYGLLSGLVYMREHHLVHGNLSMTNIDFDSRMNPVINNLDFGFSTKELGGMDIPLTDRSQLYFAFEDIVPPELENLRQDWKAESSYKVNLRELYRSTDLFVLGTIFLQLLCHGWRKSSKSKRFSNCPETIPYGYSSCLFSLLSLMVTESDRNRPSSRHARIRVGILLFGPAQGEVNSMMECQIWQQTRMMKLLMQSSNCSITQQFCDNYMRTIKCSIGENGKIFEKDFLTTICATELWNVYKNMEWPT